MYPLHLFLSLSALFEVAFTLDRMEAVETSPPTSTYLKHKDHYTLVNEPAHRSDAGNGYGSHPDGSRSRSYSLSSLLPASSQLHKRSPKPPSLKQCCLDSLHRDCEQKCLAEEESWQKYQRYAKLYAHRPGWNRVTEAYQRDWEKKLVAATEARRRQQSTLSLLRSHSGLPPLAPRKSVSASGGKQTSPTSESKRTTARRLAKSGDPPVLTFRGS